MGWVGYKDEDMEGTLCRSEWEVPGVYDHSDMLFHQMLPLEKKIGMSVRDKYRKIEKQDGYVT
jgi:hypothetical protein